VPSTYNKTIIIYREDGVPGTGRIATTGAKEAAGRGAATGAAAVATVGATRDDRQSVIQLKVEFNIQY
jgi:hypothetical protein